MKLIIDRFEGDYAVCECEDKKMMDIPKNLIPTKAIEGDVLCFDGDTYLIDKDATNMRKERIKTLMNDVWAD